MSVFKQGERVDVVGQYSWFSTVNPQVPGSSPGRGAKYEKGLAIAKPFFIAFSMFAGPERRRLGKLEYALGNIYFGRLLAGPYMGHGLEFERWPQPVCGHTQQASQRIDSGINKIIALAASAVLLGFARAACHVNRLEFALCALFLGFKKSGLRVRHAANGLAITAMADQLCNGRLGEGKRQLTTLTLCAEGVVHSITHVLGVLRSGHKLGWQSTFSLSSLSFRFLLPCCGIFSKIFDRITGRRRL